MDKLSPQEMAVFLRRCANGVCDDSCPWMEVPTKCEEQMMRDAAELLEEVAEDGWSDTGTGCRSAAKMQRDEGLRRVPAPR